MTKELQYVFANERLVNDSLRVALEERNGTTRIELSQCLRWMEFQH